MQVKEPEDGLLIKNSQRQRARKARWQNTRTNKQIHSSADQKVALHQDKASPVNFLHLMQNSERSASDFSFLFGISFMLWVYGCAFNHCIICVKTKMRFLKHKMANSQSHQRAGRRCFSPEMVETRTPLKKQRCYCDFGFICTFFFFCHTHLSVSFAKLFIILSASNEMK